MAHPLAALLLAGKVHQGEPDMEDGESKEDTQLDCVRHLIAAVHSKKEEDVLECFKNLLELCREDDMDMEDKDQDDDAGEASDSY